MVAFFFAKTYIFMQSTGVFNGFEHAGHRRPGTLQQNYAKKNIQARTTAINHSPRAQQQTRHCIHVNAFAKTAASTHRQDTDGHLFHDWDHLHIGIVCGINREEKSLSSAKFQTDRHL
jgi:hypothetical protein